MTTVRGLLADLEARGIRPNGVTDDSRRVAPGSLFLAYPGDLADGRRYIPDALARGAAAVLWQPGGDFAWDAGWRAPHRSVSGLRALAGPLAHEVLGRPSERLSLVAITGTNGKTTVSQWLARAYPGACAVIGTLGAGFPDELQETGFTTPEATALVTALADFQGRGARACALEASSIGIEEGRMNGLRVDVAVFTNLTRDHLDYHGTMEAYSAAKERLFKWPSLRTAVINLDDPFGRLLFTESSASRILGTTVDGGEQASRAAARAEHLEATPEGQSFTLVLPNGRHAVRTAILGRYNVSNLLAVAAVLYDAGLEASDIAARLQALAPPPGRMERLGGTAEPLLVVDYAHTPDALAKALEALREVAAARGGKLAVVFGCGGDRDRGKRPLMGEVATRGADVVIVTSDNPRQEEPAAIIADILPGAPAARVIEDRAEAIRAAVAVAADADVVLLAGKGHEPYQERKGVRTPFSDLAEARAALAQRQEKKR